MKRPERGEIGQTAAEFALVGPVLVLLFFGLTLSAFYTFRAAAADWGVFIVGNAEGAFDTPASGQARGSVPWPDVAAAIGSGMAGEELRAVRAGIDLRTERSWLFGIRLAERHSGAAFFRLWRFYPGPPEGGVE